MKYNIFDTLEEATIAQEYDFQCFKASGKVNAQYWDVTKSWAIPTQTVDCKWAYLVCPHSDREYQTIEFSEGLFITNQDS
jgi:hypothetical protein